jgi:hypothetical protein
VLPTPAHPLMRHGGTTTDMNRSLLGAVLDHLVLLSCYAAVRLQCRVLMWPFLHRLLQSIAFQDKPHVRCLCFQPAVSANSLQWGACHMHLSVACPPFLLYVVLAASPFASRESVLGWSTRKQLPGSGSAGHRFLGICIALQCISQRGYSFRSSTSPVQF